MLRKFKAALHRTTRPRQYEQWAGVVADMLGVAAVAIVDADTPSEVLAQTADKAKLTGEIVANAVKVGVSVPRAYDEYHVFSGVPIDAPPPFGRVINLLIKHEHSRVLCIIFPVLPGVTQPALSRTEALGERRMAEIALLERYRSDLKRFVTMFNHMERTAQIGLWELRLDLGELRMSDEVKRILDLPQQTVLTPLRALRFFPRAARRQLIEAVIRTRDGGDSASYSLPVLTMEGAPRTVRVFITRHRTGEGVMEIAGVLQDVTEQQLATEKLWWTANHDTLTELPNRALFADRFRKALARRERTKQLVCLILVDVDKFKAINDTFG
ncbi:MAG: GGDEF domain-containing protein, partial [Pseudomonadota bacterium]